MCFVFLFLFSFLSVSRETIRVSCVVPPLLLKMRRFTSPSFVFSMPFEYFYKI